MPTRRQMLQLISAGTLLPFSGPARASSAATHVACAQTVDGRWVTAGLDRLGQIAWQTDLPGRGHGVADHPSGPDLVVFARRPGRFALILDKATGDIIGRIDSLPGRHFYGHGTFSADGRLLFSTENDFAAERGVIGLYDAKDGFRRLGEWDSGGIGPHEVILSRSGERLVIANGGIATHPDYPRAKLNLETMRPSIALLDAKTGALLDRASLPPARHKLSLRHLAEASDGSIWIGGQYEGAPSDAGALMVRYTPGQGLTEIDVAPELYRAMRAYIGSVAAIQQGRQIVGSGPRGAGALVWRAETKALQQHVEGRDLSGVASAETGLITSDGTGRIHVDGKTVQHAVRWDNHLTALS